MRQSCKMIRDDSYDDSEMHPQEKRPERAGRKRHEPQPANTLKLPPAHRDHYDSGVKAVICNLMLP